MRVLSVTIAVVLAFVASALALTDLKTGDDLAPLRRAYLPGSDPAESALTARARTKGKPTKKVFCIDKGQAKRYRSDPDVAKAQQLHEKALGLQKERNNLRQQGQLNEAKVKEAEYLAAKRTYENSPSRAAVSKFERAGCTAGIETQFSSAHNCRGKAYYFETPDGQKTCTKLAKNTPPFESGECFV